MLLEVRNLRVVFRRDGREIVRHLNFSVSADVNEIVGEVFEVTGFSDILDIE